MKIQTPRSRGEYWNRCTCKMEISDFAETNMATMNNAKKLNSRYVREFKGLKNNLHTER
jgi:hypothetical protein